MPLQPYATNRNNLQRRIPEDVKLLVRRRCGFGCVICGLGLYEYEHFAPEFKDAYTHDPNGITLLCPNHHTRKTVGRLSIEAIERANNNPAALRQGFANDRFDFSSDNPVVILGRTTFERVEVIVQVFDEPILSVLPGTDTNEPFLLSTKLRDSRGEIILEVEKNEWKSSTANWDCKVEGNTIIIRSAPRKIQLILRQEPPNLIVIERLRMVHRGFIIEANEGSGLSLSTQSKTVTWGSRGMIVRDFKVGFCLYEIDRIGLGFGYVSTGPGSVGAGPGGGYFRGY